MLSYSTFANRPPSRRKPTPTRSSNACSTSSPSHAKKRARQPQAKLVKTSFTLNAKVGSAVAPTKDLFGWGGAVKLANADAEQLAKDYAAIEALCHSGLWTIE